MSGAQSDRAVVSGAQSDGVVVSAAKGPNLSPEESAVVSLPGEPKLHILAAIVENKFGVLARIAGLFSRRGFNIFSLAVAPTANPEYSRITIVVDVQDTDVNQIAKQLDKLVNVIDISELQPATSVERELLLARVGAVDLEAVVEVISEYGGEVLDHTGDEAIVSVSAHPLRLDRCERQLRPFGLHVLQRTGRIALRALGADQPAVGLNV